MASEPVVLSNEGRLAFYQSAATRDAEEEHNYEGLRIHAVDGLHDAVCDLARAAFPQGCAVLDVASGSGAMCRRLQRAGYAVTGCDAIEENFRLKGEVPFHVVDLNSEFSTRFGRQFDAITATEIIEHLENPRQFLRQCYATLAPGGRLIISTPNLETALSKAFYAVWGNARWYTDRDYLVYGHITPLPLWVLQKSLLEAGFIIDQVTSHGAHDVTWRGWWKMRLLASIFRLIDRADSPQGDILIIAAHKPA